MHGPHNTRLPEKKEKVHNEPMPERYDPPLKEKTLLERAKTAERLTDPAEFLKRSRAETREEVMGAVRFILVAFDENVGAVHCALDEDGRMPKQSFDTAYDEATGEWVVFPSHGGMTSSIH